MNNIKDTKKDPIVRKFKGEVVSDKMDKTIVVKVEKVKIHPKYNKRYMTSKKYKVHDEKNKYKEGDFVVFQPCRPISKDKKWRVIYQ
jgi:small subunit ribosomal protein S17